MEPKSLHPYFVGAYGENGDILISMLQEFIQDHIYWRRNFHPESVPPIPPSSRHTAQSRAFIDKLKEEMFRLSADLKRSVPFFSPRYVGHMSSDLLLPGLLAHMVTTLFNPNNVAESAAPATVEKEIVVGEQLAAMLGYPIDEAAPVRAWGHITSGGTVANFEGLRNALAVKYYPVAVRAACEALGLTLPSIDGLSLWSLINLPAERVYALRSEAAEVHGQALMDEIEAHRLEHLGVVTFFQRYPCQPPVILVSGCGHYSWAKAAKLMGLGTANIVHVPVDATTRLDGAAFARIVDELNAQEIPIALAVGVLGTTEFGNIDPLDQMLDVRDASAATGVWFPVHIDAAFGGYMQTIFRATDGSFRAREEVAKSFRYFPSQRVYDAFAAIPRADSVTIDPHKLGYIPFGAGAYISKDRRILDFILHSAAYINDPCDDESKIRRLGEYILEGSKPGAPVASAYVTHHVLPLDHTAFGELLGETVRSAEYFFEAFAGFKYRIAQIATVTIPFEPDTNLVSIAINPKGNRSLAEMNTFERAVFKHLSVEVEAPIQRREFIASFTSIPFGRLTVEDTEALLNNLDIDVETFVPKGQGQGDDTDHIYLFRHTLMNPWLLYREDGRKTYIDRYFDHLVELVEAAARKMYPARQPVNFGGPATKR